MLKNLFLSLKKLRQTKATRKLALVIFVLAFISAVFVIPIGASAAIEVGNLLTNALAYILDFILSLVGALISLVLSILINIAQFNEFTSAAAVTTGWVLIRDICNMFFIVILLVISVGTVLGIQSYSYKNFLKKVIIMAILINFSKTIAGFLIDISQVIMLTFVAAFKDSIVIGFSEGFGLNKLKSLAISINAAGEVEQDNYALLLGMGLSLALSVILLLVLVSVVAMLAYRIVVLWILVVLSPFAYLASAMPGNLGGQANKQWWTQFTEQLIVGPAIAFFLWLTLSVVSTTGGSFTRVESPVNPTSPIGGALATAPFLLNYFIGIMLLVVGMKMAQQMGGKSGAVMGKTFDKTKSAGWKGLKSVGRGVKGTVSYALDAGRDALAGGKEARKKKLEETMAKGGVRGLLAARSLDTQKARDKRRQDWQGEKLKKIGFGGKESFKTLDTIAGAGLKEAQDTAKNKRSDEAAIEFAGDEVMRANLVAEERTSQERKAKEGAKMAADKDWEGFSEVKKAEFGGDKREYSASLEAAAVAAIDDNAVENAAKNKYMAAEGEKAAKQAKIAYQGRILSNFNPLKPAFEYATIQAKSIAEAKKLQGVISTTPGALVEGDFIDKKGNAKADTIKSSLGEMSELEIQNLIDHWAQEEKNGTKDADKVKGELLTALKYASDNKFGVAAQNVYNALPNKSQIIKRLGKSEKLSDIKIGKSKEFLSDVDPEKVVSAATEIENEISYLGNTEVRDMVGDGGWKVDTKRSDLAKDKVALIRGGETKEVTKDEFMQQNGTLTADHFYNSDRYERLKADRGEDAIASREEYDTYIRIGDSSQEGITIGSLAMGGNMAAVDMADINARLKGGLIGKERKAGMFVRGEEAVRAASAMEELLDEQVVALESAETDDDIKVALGSFGVKPSEKVDLQGLKATTLNKAIQAKDNLHNEDRIKEEGLILINKARTGREARGLIRHEKAHDLIGKVDPDGTMQDEVWNKMSDKEKEEARIYIRKDRNQSDIAEEEIKKEYIADAVANAYKPGGPDTNKPQLPPSIADSISAITGGETGISSKIELYNTRKAVAKDENVANSVSYLRGMISQNKILPETVVGQLEGLRDNIRNSDTIKSLPQSSVQDLDQQIESIISKLSAVDNFSSNAGRAAINDLNRFASGFGVSLATANQTKPIPVEVVNLASNNVPQPAKNIVKALMKDESTRNAVGIMQDRLKANQMNPNSAIDELKGVSLNIGAVGEEQNLPNKDIGIAQAEVQSLISDVQNVGDFSSDEGGRVLSNIEKFVDNYTGVSQPAVQTIDKSSIQSRQGPNVVNVEAQDSQQSASISAQNVEGASSSQQPKSVKAETNIEDIVSNIQKAIANNNISIQQMASDMRDLENKIQINASEQVGADYDKFLEELRGLISQVDNIPDTDEEQSNIIAGQLNTFLGNIPAGMLDAGKKKQRKQRPGTNN